MHAGSLDVEWSTAMREQSDQMKADGYHIKFTMEPGQTHRLKAAQINLSQRLFDEIESCR
jgi:hypothetical protein